ncbi:hypothetical protein CEXT_364151 [Caerostris extrusa]|uniref:Uncharacterized protein n=1 Tax=Caerostris extrusa TaxID=172846 RepID=A0AAV4TZD0_CAEEX|nr:hypothetical protein CEXT_364151 [Caerostris extrusa]
MLKKTTCPENPLAYNLIFFTPWTSLIPKPIPAKKILMPAISVKNFIKKLRINHQTTQVTSQRRMDFHKKQSLKSAKTPEKDDQKS